MTEVVALDPSEVHLYRGRGSVPRDAVRVEVDRSVRLILDRLFQYCSRLVSVLLHEGLLKIGDWAFRGCTSLRSIKLPSTVTEIGEGAFQGCSDLTTVDLPERLESIEGRAFFRCASLEAARIPASVSWIGADAFFGCVSLVSVDLVEGLEMIGSSAFEACRSLRSVRIPSSVVEIKEAAFQDCINLTSVELHEDLPRIRQLALSGCPLENFRFVPLSDHREVIRMDAETKSMFDSRLREMTLAITGADHNDDEENEGLGERDDWEVAESFRGKCTRSLERAHKFLAYLELKGAAPVLELALWKARIEGQGARGDRIGSGGQDPSDAAREMKGLNLMTDIGQDSGPYRKECGVRCGADIVFAEVLKFFAYSTSWPRLDD